MHRAGFDPAAQLVARTQKSGHAVWALLHDWPSCEKNVACRAPGNPLQVWGDFLPLLQGGAAGPGEACLVTGNLECAGMRLGCCCWGNERSGTRRHHACLPLAWTEAGCSD